MTFGEKLQTLRVRKGLSQERLAEELGVSRQAVSKWERDETLPETEKVIRISDYFGVTLDHLLKDEPENAQNAPTSGRNLLEWLTAWDKQYGYLLALIPLAAGLGGIVWSLAGENRESLRIFGLPGALLLYCANGFYLSFLPLFFSGVFGLIFGWRLRGRLCWYHICVLPVFWGGSGLILQETMYLLAQNTAWIESVVSQIENWLLPPLSLHRHPTLTFQWIAALTAGLALFYTAKAMEKRGR